MTKNVFDYLNVFHLKAANNENESGQLDFKDYQ